ncbi:era: GTP-binding protein Era [Rubrobacter radiotolerans]|uniref:GTPase Era n=1 Tax=Rubrobacter radiotolerans TaxID=42256 RepID=A0A023X3L9_RUBRA|nr:GTPase Era [Rubrobacter radiotolerans]AHY46796.1 era: GTP-binding protein Era [Rubrobacter radiotolerans]MDX5894203.1 GTPase Era [Rubrobacter radiotolerans]SMC05463.1 GTP-binding protein Era [Rubrobacter radiotolerans DSM 5868]
MSEAGRAASEPEGFRSGFIAVVGRPNVGKSTLVNRLVGRKVSITSSRPQTTRNPIRGVRNGEGYQAVFVDTPGSQKPRDTLRHRMQEQVLESLSESDAILFVLDASAARGGFGGGDRYVAKLVSEAETPTVACLNKVDLLARHDDALPLLAELSQMGDWRETFAISASTGRNTSALMRTVVDLLPEGPVYFPEGVVTDYPETFIISEFIREKALGVLREEVPHAVAVEIDEVERKENVTVIYAILHVERKSQRMIVLGKNGQTIRRIGSEARREVERLLGVRIYLDLKVRVTPGWRSNRQFLERLGL